MTARSYLYVPGDKPEMLAKAAERGADALIIDLEDAVAPERKTLARAALREFLPSPCPAWVRVNNHPELLEDDIAAAANSAGIIVPKAEPDVLTAVAEATTRPITALIETAAGVLATAEVARVKQVQRLAIGEADLAAELGVSPGPDGLELLFARSQVVVASAAAGLDAPTAPVFTDFRDGDGLRRSTLALSRLGFGSRAAIHPAQVPVINEVFTPTATELADALALLDAYEQARASGQGAGAVHGVMFDVAVVRQARRVIDRAQTTP